MKRNQLKAFLILPAVLAFIFGNAQSYEDQISKYLKSDKKWLHCQLQSTILKLEISTTLNL